MRCYILIDWCKNDVLSKSSRKNFSLLICQKNMRHKPLLDMYLIKSNHIIYIFVKKVYELSYKNNVIK